MSDRIDAVQTAIDSSEMLLRYDETVLLSRQKLPHFVWDGSSPIVPGDNFHQMETMPDGIGFRWTGPGRVNNLQVPIDRTCERTLRISVLRELIPGAVASMKVYVDGEITPVSIEPADQGYEVFAQLPVSARVQDTMISLFVSRVEPPEASADGAVDPRALGLAITKIEVV